MRRFVVTLVVAAILAVASLFPLARSASAAPSGNSPWRDAAGACPTPSGDVGRLYYHETNDNYHCFRD